MGIQVCFLLRVNFDHKANGEREAFLANPMHQYHGLNEEKMIVVPLTKRVEIIMSIQVCLISRLNINYEENGGKKTFSCESKASISYILMRKT